MGNELCFPVWEQLLENEDDEDGFAWPVYSGWLGALKLGLVLEGVDGGGELYSRILPIYEKSAEDMARRTKGSKTMRGPNVVSYLWFRHVGDGWFRLKVEHEKMIPAAERRRVTTESESKRRFQKMTSDAFHIRRTRKHPFVFRKFCHAFFEPVKHLPGNSEGKESTCALSLRLRSFIKYVIPSTNAGNSDEDLQYIEGCQSPVGSLNSLLFDFLDFALLVSFSGCLAASCVGLQGGAEAHHSLHRSADGEGRGDSGPNEARLGYKDEEYENK